MAIPKLTNTPGGPFSTTGSKDVRMKMFQVARTETTYATKAFLPAQAVFLGTYVINSAAVASDAATTATIDVQAITGAGTVNLRTGMDVKTAIDATGTIGGRNAGSTTLDTQYPNLTDIQIQARYQETGTASTTGSPWYVIVLWTDA